MEFQNQQRVLSSTASCCLSFGKFLELSFCHHSSSSRLSSRGHSLHRDFLYFFGLGPMAAMLTSATTYTVSVPPQKLELSNSIDKEWLKEEFQNVCGLSDFASILEFWAWLNVTLALSTTGMSLFTEVECSLKQIGSRFIGSMLNLQGSLKEFSVIVEMLKQEHAAFEVGLQNAVAKNGNPDEAFHKLLNLNRLRWELLIESCIWDKRLHSLLLPDPELVINGAPEKGVQEQPKSKMEGTAAGGNEGPENNSEIGDKVSIDASNHYSGDDNIRSEDFLLRENLQAESAIPNSADLLNNDPNASERNMSPRPLLSNLEKLNGWFWMPFSELRQIYMKDLQSYVPKFESVSSYTPEHLPAVNKLICEEGSRQHIPLGTDNYFVSDYEGELSSIIACALALKDLPPSTAIFNEDRFISRSSDSDSVNSAPSICPEVPCFSCLGGLNFFESPVPLEILSPEVFIGASKSLGKGKYSVKCLYANQFLDLRSQCCLSKLDYIGSLSRCRNWDAKGGKSKSMFAKTLDDRFIIKEIKKTEFDSFDKFASHYFKYMNDSFDLRNQTCLAKVFGIYQVTVRQPKSGKETRHELMVMENLTYGRSIVRQYDLKGALNAWRNSVVDGAGEVLLDQNFVNDVTTSPLYVSYKAKRLLERAVWNDTNFLSSIDVMDYSLLVGVDTGGRVLVCGIIDYLRQYTWDKKLETWVKYSLVPKNVLPTVISPKEYKKRFKKFMSTHFLSAPDHG